MLRIMQKLTRDLQKEQPVRVDKGMQGQTLIVLDRLKNEVYGDGVENE